MADELLRQAVNLARAGKKVEARRILEDIVQREPENEKAWMWLVDSMSNEEERIATLERALNFIPGSQMARNALTMFNSRRAVPSGKEAETPATTPFTANPDLPHDDVRASILSQKELKQIEKANSRAEAQVEARAKEPKADEKPAPKKTVAKPKPVRKVDWTRLAIYALILVIVAFAVEFAWLATRPHQGSGPLAQEPGSGSQGNPKSTSTPRPIATFTPAAPLSVDQYVYPEGKNLRDLGNTRQVIISPDGSRLITNNGQEVMIWDMSTGQEAGRLILSSSSESSWPGPVVVDPVATLIAIAGKDLTIYSLDQLSQIKVLPILAPVTVMGFRSDGKTLVTVSGGNTLNIWNARKGDVLQTISVTGNLFRLDSDAHYLASANSDNQVTIWDTSSGQSVYTFSDPTDVVDDIAFNKMGTQVAAASEDGNVYLWDLSTGKLVKSVGGLSTPLNQLTFRPDGTQLAVLSSNKIIEIIDIEQGKVVQNLEGNTETVNQFSYSPDSVVIASATSNDGLEFWNTETAAQLSGIHFSVPGTNPSSLAFSPDGRHLAASVGSIWLWQVKNP